MSPRPPPAAATTSAAVDRLATPAHAHNNSAPCAWPTWPCPSPNPSAGWTFGPAAAPEALAHTSPASPTTLTRPPNAVIRSPHTAIPARARDHLQRTRAPHELSFTTRSQGPTGGKLTLLGGAAKHHLCPGASTRPCNHGLSVLQCHTQIACSARHRSQRHKPLFMQFAPPPGRPSGCSWISQPAAGRLLTCRHNCEHPC